MKFKKIIFSYFVIKKPQKITIKFLFSDTNGEQEDQVLEWKFNTLDIDRNGWLNRDEYAELRRLVRKVVRPKRCARSFARHCDLDRDLRITRQEWTSCLALHLNREFLMFRYVFDKKYH